MNVGQLIKRLEKLDPNTVVVKFGKVKGYNEVHFISGTHNHGPCIEAGEAHLFDGIYLRVNREKWVKGTEKPDFDILLAGSRAKKFPYVVFY